MRQNWNRNVKLGAAAGAVLLVCLSSYAATTVVLGVGTIPQSELFAGPATVTVRQLLIAPGEVLAWHYHPGRAYNVIKRGTLTVEDGCGQEEVFKAGGAFEETELHVHRAKNLGTEEVEVYNTFIVPEGQPTTVNIPDNERRCGSLEPVFMLEATRFCSGSPWTLKVNHGLFNSPVNLLGTSAGKSWKVSNWGRTDATGGLSIGGTFVEGTEGTHTLRVEIGGLFSNTISFAVSKCPQ